MLRLVGEAGRLQAPLEQRALSVVRTESQCLERWPGPQRGSVDVCGMKDAMGRISALTLYSVDNPVPFFGARFLGQDFLNFLSFTFLSYKARKHINCLLGLL